MLSTRPALRELFSCARTRNREGAGQKANIRFFIFVWRLKGLAGKDGFFTPLLHEYEGGTGYPEWFLSQKSKCLHMQKTEMVSDGRKSIRSKVSGMPEKEAERSETTLTGEEKRIFDAVFAGAIIGASLTALLFIFL